MIEEQIPESEQWELACIGELMPDDHILRKVAKHVDFTFIREKTKDLYCLDNGRPGIDPVVLFKMLFIGYLFGIRSERRLVDEINVNLAYRWFLGFGLRTRVPNHSTLSQNRRRRFNGTPVYQEIFDEVVRQAIKANVVDGHIIYSDSTHIKAKANKHKVLIENMPKSIKGYMGDLDKAVEEDRTRRGLKQLRPRKEVETEFRRIKVSTTDPESGYMVRQGKPEGFFYLDHRSVDEKHNFITDVYVTAANQSDAEPYLARLERQQKTFGFDIHAVALDAGYLTTPICKGLEEKGIFAVIGHRRFHPVQGLFPKWKFHYETETDTYTCPDGKTLTYRTTNREGFRLYRSRQADCSACEMRNQCTRSRAMQKLLTRHVWEDAKDRVRENRLTDYGKQVYARRKETIERSFADGKELHGLRYARMKGLSKVTEQCLLSAWAQNVKKLALVLSRREKCPQMA